MRMIASLAAAAALMLGLANTALAADDIENETVIDAIEEPANTLFDLGIDVAPVPKTPGAVRAYLASLSPLTRGVILSTCEHYMDTPASVQEDDTVQFCSLATGG